MPRPATEDDDGRWVEKAPHPDHAGSAVVGPRVRRRLLADAGPPTEDQAALLPPLQAVAPNVKDLATCKAMAALLETHDLSEDHH